MHHWIKYCVNRCLKSEVIALTSFVTADRRMDALHFYSLPPQWLRHGGGQKGEIILVVVTFQSIKERKVKVKAIGRVHNYIIIANC